MRERHLNPDCIFCKVVTHQAPAEIVHEDISTIIFVPLNPHVPGHVIVVPKFHVASAIEDPRTAGDMMQDAATYARRKVGHCNILASVGEEATQTIMHLHVHVIPRGPDDGLGKDWPWMRPGHE